WKATRCDLTSFLMAGDCHKSRTWTSAPSSSHLSTTWVPINPDPPVTTTFTADSASVLFGDRCQSMKRSRCGARNGGLGIPFSYWQWGVQDRCGAEASAIG